MTLLSLINLSYSENDKGIIFRVWNQCKVFLPVNGLVAQEQKIDTTIIKKT